MRRRWSSWGSAGSYLGAKGAVELLRPHPQPGDPKILFAGNSLSPDALMHLLEELGDLDFDINVVSKSGTTLEPALAFRMFRGLLEAKYGTEKAKKHIFATTDAHRGVLKQMADEEGWETFVVPDDVRPGATVCCPLSACCRWPPPASTCRP